VTTTRPDGPTARHPRVAFVFQTFLLVLGVYFADRVVPGLWRLLTSDASSAQSGPIEDVEGQWGHRRQLFVRAACDEEFRAQDEWEARMRRRIETASEEFDQRFGIRWTLKDVVEWKSDDSAPTLEALLTQLSQDVSRRGIDVVIGFSGQVGASGAAKGYAHVGIAKQLGTVALVRSPEGVGWDWNRGVLVHELGHVLGAWHSDVPSSIMRSGADESIGDGEFDPQAAAMIEFVRDSGFPRGTKWIVGDARRRVDEIFASGHARGETRPYER